MACLLRSWQWEFLLAFDLLSSCNPPLQQNPLYLLTINPWQPLSGKTSTFLFLTLPDITGNLSLFFVSMQAPLSTLIYFWSATPQYPSIMHAICQFQVKEPPVFRNSDCCGVGWMRGDNFRNP